MNVVLLLTIIVIFVVFFVENYAVYVFTEKMKNFPKWLMYDPFQCRTCCTFWTLLTTYMALTFVFNNKLFLLGIVLAVLNAIAMKINDRKTVN